MSTTRATAAPPPPRRRFDPARPERLRLLCAALPQRSPLFVQLARYLSTRLDIFSGDECRELAAAARPTAPLTEAAVRERLRAELGEERAAYIDTIVPAPVVSLPLAQTHHAALTDGRRVTIKIARTEVAAAGAADGIVEWLGQVSAAGWPLLTTEPVLAQFHDVVRAGLDLRNEGEALRQLAAVPADVWHVRAPVVVQTLSSARVLTLDPACSDPPFVQAASAGAHRTLMDLWLNLLLRDILVEDVSAEAVRLSASGEITITSGLFQPTAAEDREALWDYLSASVRGDPDRTAGALCALAAPGDDARPDGLRQSLGHVVPRRDGRFGHAPPGLPELLLSHWPQLAAHGLRARPPLVAFYRGLVSLRDLCGPSLERETFRDALKAAQVWRGSRWLEQALEPGTLARGADAALQVVMEVSRRVDEARGPGRYPVPPRRASDRSGEERPRASRLTAAALLAGTMAVWLSQWAALPALARAAVLVAAAIGGIALLRLIWRS